jgi:hypothetical protein
MKYSVKKHFKIRDASENFSVRSAYVVNIVSLKAGCCSDGNIYLFFPGRGDKQVLWKLIEKHLSPSLTIRVVAKI